MYKNILIDIFDNITCIDAHPDAKSISPIKNYEMTCINPTYLSEFQILPIHNYLFL